MTTTVLQDVLGWLSWEFRKRLGNDYVYGGSYAEGNRDQGCDCSYVAGWALEALAKGPVDMSWAHVVSTESWPYDYPRDAPAPPGTVGPYGTVSVGSDASALPADAALWIDIMHGGGGENSHMNVILPDGTIMESNGGSGSCTNGTGGADQHDGEWTDHWYLPVSAVVGATRPPPPPGPPAGAATTRYYPDVSNNNWSSVAQLTAFLAKLHAEGFAGVVHKVSEGAGYKDPYWRACRSWCEDPAHPLSWLGYHYVTTEAPAAQAANFVANNGGANAMLDFEANSGGIDQFWAVVNAFNDAGVNVSMAYIPRWYWQRIGSPDLSALADEQIQLVSSNYPAGSGYASQIYENAGGDGGPGWAGYGGATPTAWQFTDRASIAGAVVDCNAYRGPGSDLNLDALFTGNG